MWKIGKIKWLFQNWEQFSLEDEYLDGPSGKIVFEKPPGEAIFVLVCKYKAKHHNWKGKYSRTEVWRSRAYLNNNVKGDLHLSYFWIFERKYTFLLSVLGDCFVSEVVVIVCKGNLPQN